MLEMDDNEGSDGHVQGTKIPLQFRARRSSAFGAPPSRCDRDWILKRLNGMRFTFFIMFLVLMDIILLIVSESLPDDDSQDLVLLSDITLVIVSIFLLEVLLRIYAQSWLFFYSAFSVVDAMLVLASFILVLLQVLNQINFNETHELVLLTRVLKYTRIFRVFSRVISHGESITMAFRHTVTMNKQRYQKDGYDLDLVYITPRIIAMSVPAQLFNGGPLRHRLECLYRNPVNEVARFFNSKHKGHYRIYNTCCERTYNFEKFHKQVKRIDIIDHSVPRLSAIYEFCKDVEQWMNENPKNVFAVHCKGGKGRTGTLISAWLLYEYRGESAASALNYFANRRTDFSKGSKLQGVDTPSQSRYVRSFDSLLRKGIDYLQETSPLQLVFVKFEHLALVSRQEKVTWRCSVKVYDDEKRDVIIPAHQRRDAHKPNDPHNTYQICEESTTSVLTDELIFESDDRIVIHGDCHFIFEMKPEGEKKFKRFCAFWIHTAFIDRDGDHVIPKLQIDHIFKDHSNEKCGSEFQLRIGTEEVHGDIASV